MATFSSCLNVARMVLLWYMLCINDVINSRWEGDGWGYIKTNSIFCSRSISYSGASIPKAKGSSVFRGLLHFPWGGGRYFCHFCSSLPKMWYGGHVHVTMPAQLTALAHGLCSHLGRRAEDPALQFLSVVKMAGAVTQIQMKFLWGNEIGCFPEERVDT